MESANSQPLLAGLFRCLLLTLAIAASGCGGSSGGSDDGNGSGGSTATPTALDIDLEQMTGTKGLTGDPAASRGLMQTPPSEDPLVKLGQLLFFSQTLSGGFDSSCGTCHHPDFAGSDGLSIPVGVVPKHRTTVGPGREVNAVLDLDPQADGGPNMHRNSITTFNAALFDRTLMYDGRVSVLDEETVAGGHGQSIRTPESGRVADITGADGLMEHTMKGPIVNDNEMRGFLFANQSTPVEYREHLVARLRGEVDTLYMQPDAATAAANWLERFRAGFDDPNGSADELITMLNMQKALAAYVNSQVFVNTPWRDYLNGDLNALSEDAKKGAMLFFESEAGGGLGCASCHSGDKFSDERFHNVGFPQIGRGFARADRKDVGRWTQTQAPEDLHAFRTPSLLNIAQTGPYGHAGAFDTLEGVINYHANPRDAVLSYGFDLQHLAQYQGTDIEYPYARSHTEEAIAADGFAAAEAMLPGRTLTDTEVRQLVVFLESLTDACVANPSCVDDWTPVAGDDPDGHLLVRGASSTAPGSINAETPEDYPETIALDFPQGLPAQDAFADTQGCTSSPAVTGGSGMNRFTLRSADPDFGLSDPHGFSEDTWYLAHNSQVDPVMIAGGVSAAYVDDDCWPDLVFAGGDASGIRFYENLSGAGFADMGDLLTDDPGVRFTGAAVADLNGDYRRELLFGNLHGGDIPIYSPNGNGQFARIAGLPMARNTYGISFAPLDDTGYPYLYAAHWTMNGGTAGGSPALWKNDGGDELRPWDSQARTTLAYIDQRFNFTPKFADFTGDSRPDLVIASDFGTSVTLANRPVGENDFVFDNVTDPQVVTDQNGMGSTLLDRNNDGALEWFVTAIYDEVGATIGTWGYDRKSSVRIRRNR